MISRALLALVLGASVASCIHVSQSAPSNTVASAHVQPSRDGWGAFEGAVTGGLIAPHVTEVSNRRELVTALRAGDSPKFIVIKGTIDLATDDAGRPLKEEDFRDPAFSWSAYESTYAPATWGKNAVTGALEEARQRSAKKHGEHVVLAVGSNTTILGQGADAKLINGGLMLRDVHNIVLRNLHFEDAYDFFPQWDPNDNANGEWNALYDNVTIYNSRRVWIDHCTFSDGARPDAKNRAALGRPMQFHDGLLDIVRGSDLITLSYNHFHSHDKAMLIGNSDRLTSDDGKLRITLHHNWFENVKERAPRVRFGRVHVANNLYSATPNALYPYGYSIGIGVNGQPLVENNVFDLPHLAAPRLFKYWRGTTLRAQNNLLNGAPVDAFAMLSKEAPNVAWKREVDWVAPPFAETPIEHLAAHVRANAGAGRLR